jgi:hypothetical protein
MSGPEIWLSPSQVATKRRCFRCWGYQYILGFKPPQTGDQQFGIDGHLIVQRYLGQGIQPPNDDVGRTALQGIERGFLPAPGPGLHLEHKIKAQMAQGFVLNGVVDLINARDPILHVLDHKFVKSLKYAKEPGDALDDPQSVIYCAVALSMRPAAEIDWSWVYYAAKGKERPRIPCGARKVTRRMTPADLEPGWQKVLADCKEMVDAKRAGTRPEALPHNPLACDDYSGCPWREICPVDHGKRLSMMIAAAPMPGKNILTHSASISYNPGSSQPDNEEDDVGLLDDLKAGMPQAPQPVAVPQTMPAGLPGPGPVNPPEGPTTAVAPVPQSAQTTAQIPLFNGQTAAPPSPQVLAGQPTMFQSMPIASPPVAPTAYIPPQMAQPTMMAPPLTVTSAPMPPVNYTPPVSHPVPQVVLAVGTPMPPSIPSRSGQPLHGFIVLIDCLKAKGEQGTQLIDALKPICQWLEQQYKVGHWSAISYNPHGAPGSAFLAKAFDDWCQGTKPTGTMLVDSSTAEARAVMEVLLSRADVVIRGIR